MIQSRTQGQWVTCRCSAPFPSQIASIAMEHCFDDLDAPVERITGADIPMPYAINLEALALPKARAVCIAKMRLSLLFVVSSLLHHLLA